MKLMKILNLIGRAFLHCPIHSVHLIISVNTYNNVVLMKLIWNVANFLDFSTIINCHTDILTDHNNQRYWRTITALSTIILRLLRSICRNSCPPTRMVARSKRVVNHQKRWGESSRLKISVQHQSQDSLAYIAIKLLRNLRTSHEHTYL